MSRLLLLVFGMLLLLAGAAGAAEKPPKPNVVVLLCDDLGYGDLGCYGHPAIKTPNLDRLASEGLRLTDYYAPSPVCSPSRAGLMTGRNPNRLGIRDWIPQGAGIFLKPEEETVAERLKAAGYRTALAGKWHLNSGFNGKEPTPGDHGFDEWLATQNNAAPTHQNPTNFVRNGKRAGPLTGNSSAIVVDEAIRFIRETRDQPFAVFVTFHAPHEQVAVPEEWSGRYSKVDDPNRAIYYGSVSLVDHEVGRLLGVLDELKLRENTLVMFTSDNGPETLKRYPNGIHSYGSPGTLRGMKLHVTEGGIRVPAILRWPAKIRRGQVSSAPVSGLDLLPTLCELAGVPLPAGRAIDGTSIAALFEGKPLRRTSPLYWQYDVAISEPWKVAVREGPWKLLGTAKLDQFALYNLEKDREETRDLAASEPERVRRMSAEMRRLHQEINQGVSQ
jgi:arylsulfatase A